MMKLVTWLVALLAWLTAFPAFGADKYWIATADNDWNSNGNWSPTGVPTDGDDIYLVTAGTASIDGFDASTNTFGDVVVGSGYTGTLGGSAIDPLMFACNKLYIAGGGATLYLYTGEVDDWGTVYIESANANQTINLQGYTTHLVGSNGLYIARGNVAVNGGTSPLVYLLKHGSTPVLTLNSGSTATTVYQLAGSVVVNTGATLTTSYFDAGLLTITDGTLTNVVQRGGTTTWNTTATLASATVFAGTFDCSKDARPRTITSLKAYTGATVNLNNGVGSVTITNDDSVGSPTKSVPLKP